MGISGLLPFLKDASTNVNIRQFEGCTVAVDTYCWIYRGAFSCAEELALGKPANGHVKYVLRYVHRMLEWGIKPVMVFDGSCLPSKKNTELKRKESKELYRKKAAQCLKEGRRNEARECFQRCIECTPQMALEVIQALHEIGVDVLVAPYEADAQLAYLAKIGVAQIVVTEDSDLVLFGCARILYKLDINGNGQLIQREKIIAITQFDSADNFERFRWMCILSGCDYLDNLPGIGLGKAKKFLKTLKKSEIEQVKVNLLKQMPKILKMPNLNITAEYIEQFKRADKTFKYQVVFDPLARKLVPLNPYGDDIDSNATASDLTYAGIFYDDAIAFQHSIGNLDVNTRRSVDTFDPSKWQYKAPVRYANNPAANMKSVWSAQYRALTANEAVKLLAAFRGSGAAEGSSTASAAKLSGDVNRVANTRALSRTICNGANKSGSSSSSSAARVTSLADSPANATKRKLDLLADLADVGDDDAPLDCSGPERACDTSDDCDEGKENRQAPRRPQLKRARTSQAAISTADKSSSSTSVIDDFLSQYSAAPTSSISSSLTHKCSAYFSESSASAATVSSSGCSISLTAIEMSPVFVKKRQQTRHRQVTASTELQLTHSDSQLSLGACLADTTRSKVFKKRESTDGQSGAAARGDEQSPRSTACDDKPANEETDFVSYDIKNILDDLNQQSPIQVSTWRKQRAGIADSPILVNSKLTAAVGDGDSSARRRAHSTVRTTSATLAGFNRSSGSCKKFERKTIDDDDDQMPKQLSTVSFVESEEKRDVQDKKEICDGQRKPPVLTERILNDLNDLNDSSNCVNSNTGSGQDNSCVEKTTNSSQNKAVSQPRKQNAVSSSTIPLNNNKITNFFQKYEYSKKSIKFVPK